MIFSDFRVRKCPWPNIHNFHQIVHIWTRRLRKCGLWLPVSENPCPNMLSKNFTYLRLPMPLAKYAKFLRIVLFLTPQDKKVNGCSPNSAGYPVLAELTISAAEH